MNFGNFGDFKGIVIILNVSVIFFLKFWSPFLFWSFLVFWGIFVIFRYLRVILVLLKDFGIDSMKK